MFTGITVSFVLKKLFIIIIINFVLFGVFFLA